MPWSMASRMANNQMMDRLQNGNGQRFAVSRVVIAFVFPGQGAQAVGMGKALADQFEICAQTFAEADAALGESLSDLIFNGPMDRLTLTENTQPAILTMSVAVCRLLEQRGLTPAFVAGPQPRRVLRACRGRHAGSSPMRCAWSATAAATCRKPCRSARARWRRSSASTRPA